MKILLALCCLSLSAFAGAASDADLVAGRSSELSQKIPASHPRLLLRADELPALRSFLASQQAGNAPLAGLMLPAPEEAALIPQPEAVKNGSLEGSKRWREGYEAANAAGVMAQRHAFAWLLTQDAAQGREAARWLMHLAGWKIDRDTYRTNDELFIQHLRPMIFAYDWAHDALSPAERDTVRAALDARLSLLAAQIQPKFSLQQPSAPDNSLSHPMRFISTLGQGGLALLNESPRAAGWLAWSYEYYLRQFPVWGGDAGGWAEGMNYWSTGITQHQRFLEGMALLGFDAPLKRPFWRNTPYFAMYGQMPYGGSFFGDLTNIMAPTGSIALILEKAAVLNRDPYPLAFARSLAQQPPTKFPYYTYDAIDAFLARFRTAQAALPEANLASLPQSRYFDDIGVVMMHSALGDAAQDIMLGFRSSPQGSASHGFADQNSFVLNAFGEPLAINSGYREFYDSAHHVGWTRQTKAKNALLFGGEGQRIKDASARGRITRFADGAHFSFASGDATEAYAPNATLALRHVFFVDRRYFVILDEASAPAAVKFQWRLHARSEMKPDAAHNSVSLAQKSARLSVRFLQPASGQLEFSQSSAFEPPVASSYRKKMPDEWHFTAQTREAAPGTRFLVLLSPSREDDAAPPPAELIQTRQGHALRAGTDIVLIADEAVRRVEAADWALEGMAASFIRQTGRLRFALVDTTRLAGPVGIESDTPLSLEGERDATLMTLQLDAPRALTLQLRPGFAVKTVSGARQWQAEADGSIRATLDPGPQTLRLMK
ncbi:heparinase II/III family protein [Uliginosibacterium paludis]|uniref:Heparinase II/III family protein n=1 Tax=Uliginosibacterium paludis TaxID=1615952 RepID=A0ABV2CV43_9RHOO